MKRRLLLTAALLLTTLVNSTYAQQQVGPSALFGKWTATEQHPSGATLTSLVQFTDDKQFTTSTTVNGKPFMKASGSWKLSGKTLEWKYEQSSHPAIQRGFVDTDEIESVGATELSLVSKQSGKKHIYQRVQ